ncbi:MAG: WYL domain-containing protein [Lachnospiraceae bacterium]|nr:WYL domain-containing protein [Lachnospiraceae bacterium]
MAKSANQKMKLILLMDYLLENTDEEHPVSMKNILDYLASNGINAERKSIYDDVETLRTYGIDIILNKGKGNTGYFVGSRDFELAELKMLVDAVASAKFITESKSRELILKLEKKASKYDAGQLQRQVYVAGRAKSFNESIYYIVDDIHKAMRHNCKIEFNYMEWSVDKKLVAKRNGKKYVVSPWLLMWNDGNYYLVAFDDESSIMKHYRVDKIKSLKINDIPRTGAVESKKINPAQYTNVNFSMYGGKIENVTLLMDNSLAGVMLDRYGTDIPMVKVDDNHFRTHINVCVSSQFFGWLCGLEGKAQITEPKEVKEQFREFLRKLVDNE